MRSERLRPLAALGIALATFAGCGNHGNSAGQSRSADHEVSVYFCKAGSDKLVATHYSAASKLAGDVLAQYVVSQWVSGPIDPNSALLVPPPDTRARVSQHGSVVDVDFSGGMTKHYAGGASDEAGLFKSLTYTVTELPGVSAVQILLNGQKEASLPGGHLELDEPLTRETFAQ